MTDDNRAGDADEPTIADRSTGDEPTRVAEPATTVTKTRVDRPGDGPGGATPVWKRPPVLIGAAAVVLLVILAVVVLGGGDDDESGELAGGSSVTNTTATTIPVPSSEPSSETTGPATSAPAPEPPPTEPDAGPPQLTGPDADICKAYVTIEDAVALVYNSGDLADDEIVSRAHTLADGIDTTVELLEGLAGEPYGEDAKTYAGFLAPMADEFRNATTREQVDEAGDKLFEPPVDISEADTRLQDEYDAQCV